MLPAVTLVLGGVNSGKSSFAERLALDAGLPRVYIATAQCYDAEMKQKITDHQRQRGPDWTTIEAPFDVAGAIASTEPNSVILIDCLSMWITNHLLSETDFPSFVDTTLAAIHAAESPIIIVSNEVGLGGVSDNALARSFAKTQGRLNQQIAAFADRVVFVAAGLPMWLKGETCANYS